MGGVGVGGLSDGAVCGCGVGLVAVVEDGAVEEGAFFQ